MYHFFGRKTGGLGEAGAGFGCSIRFIGDVLYGLMGEKHLLLL